MEANQIPANFLQNTYQHFVEWKVLYLDSAKITCRQSGSYGV